MPLFDWTCNSNEARIAWEGFLYSYSYNGYLSKIVKEYFFDTVRNYSKLRNSNFASFLTYLALERIDGYTVQDLQNGIEGLPPNGREDVLREAVRLLKGAGARREKYWENKINPFLEEIWPKQDNHKTEPVTKNMIELCIESGKKFPEALTVVNGWLQPIARSYYCEDILMKVKECNICTEFPEETLRLLDRIISRESANAYKEKLNDILNSLSGLQKERAYKKLLSYTQ